MCKNFSPMTLSPILTNNIVNDNTITFLRLAYFPSSVFIDAWFCCVQLNQVHFRGCPGGDLVPVLCNGTGAEEPAGLPCRVSSFPHRPRLCPRHGQDTRPIVSSWIYANICRADFPALCSRKSSWGIATRKQARGCCSRGHLEQWAWTWNAFFTCLVAKCDSDV